MPAIPWPTSSNPGAAPGEGSGRVLNCFSYKDGPNTRWRPAAGLDTFATLPAGEVRGALYNAGLVTAIAGTAGYQIDGGGGVTTLEQPVPGNGPVTMARNNASPPQIVGVSSVGAFVIVNGVVKPYPAPPPAGSETYTALPQVNDVAFLDAYFLFTTPSGLIIASDQNTTNVNALSFASAQESAQARPGGLLRGVVYGQQYLAFGPGTIEVLTDAGTQPFPLARADVIEAGLIGPWAIAGYEDGWAGPLIFVANDGSVRLLDGYTPTRISGEDLERKIATVADPTLLRASIYTVGGNAIWSLSAPGFTWEYNVTTGQWHERQSYQQTRWKGALTLKAFGGWVVADVAGGTLYTLDAEARSEGSDPLIWGLDSGALKDFPARIQVPMAGFDFVLGDDAVPGQNPQVMLSWSHDGGGNWGQPVSRSIGMQGRGRGRVTINRVGLTSPAGVRFQFRVSDATYSSFAGGEVQDVVRR